MVIFTSNISFSFYTTASSLRLDPSVGDDVDKLAINELFEVLATLSVV